MRRCSAPSLPIFLQKNTISFLAIDSPNLPALRYFPHPQQTKRNALKHIKNKGYILTQLVIQTTIKKVQAFTKSLQNVEMGVNVITQTVGFSPIDF